MGGKKADLVLRLREHEVVEVCKMQIDIVHEEGHVVDEADDAELDYLIVNSTAQKEAEELGQSFLSGLSKFSSVENNRDGPDDSEDEDDGSSDEAAMIVTAVKMDCVTASKVADTFAWVDKYILECRIDSARKTKKSVLSLWKCWMGHQLAAGILPDDIIDEHHMIEYLKYAATHVGIDLTVIGKMLLQSSLKKIMVMLGRVRQCQEESNPTATQSRPAHTSRTKDFFKSIMVEAQRRQMEDDDFDVAKNTILDYSLFPKQFQEIEHAIFRLNQTNCTINSVQLLVLSIIKSHFAWNWQCTTIIRGDELINLPLSCLQPHQIHIPEYLTPDGQRSGTGKWHFGVLSLYYESKVKKPGKQEPDYNFVLPHREPLRCPISSLALMLHYIFDDQRTSMIEKTQHRLMFGRRVEKPLKQGGMLGMYTTFLAETSIRSDKKQHLARRSIPTKIGHWQGNTRHEVYSSKIPKAGVTALAGFYVGENYNVPWAVVDVPTELQTCIFPFAEAALAKVKGVATPNQGTINLLELLIQLRPFLWRHVASLYAVYPSCPVFTRMPLFNHKTHPEVMAWYNEWPKLREAKEVALHDAVNHAAAFTESATQSAFMAISRNQSDMREQLEEHSTMLSTLTHRTAQFSLSKKLSVPSRRPSTLPSLSQLNVHPLSPIESLEHPPSGFTPGSLASSSHLTLSSSTMRHVQRPSGLTPASESVSGTEAQYPKFGRLCTWQAILELIRDPSWTWECWGPDTLVEGVGQKVPLQMVERQWGAKKIVGTKKGSHQRWRPTGNTNSRSWIDVYLLSPNPLAAPSTVQFVAIVNRIQLEIEQGKSSTEAIATLDEMRGNDTLPK
ncbi:hypothetical protein JB92DRAFT_3096623 [Gautieria morchelliformis]|nr:hypothetical protein JB92DRAFT_3096623 [Gautieria morchelliformis]